MRPADLRLVVDRLEFAKQDIINSQLSIIDGCESGATDAMRAIVQIQHALRELQNELRGGDDEPSEISGMASALARSNGRSAEQ